jgi:ferredoxin--NADP+ reductase
MSPELLKAKVVGRVDLTDTLMIMKIKPETRFTFIPGQYCTTFLGDTVGDYSIVSSPHEEFLEFFVELVPEGELTPKLWQVKVGDTLSIWPRAQGVFTFDDRYPNQVMVATVTGIAPFMSMIRHYLHNGILSHNFYILQGASYQDEFGYRDELEKLSKEHRNIIYIPTVSRPEEERNKGWQGERGRVNFIVEKCIQKFSLTPESTIVYACGHPRMVEDVEQKLVNKGYRVREEKYWE